MGKFSADQKLALKKDFFLPCDGGKTIWAKKKILGEVAQVGNGPFLSENPRGPLFWKEGTEGILADGSDCHHFFNFKTYTYIFLTSNTCFP